MHRLDTPPAFISSYNQRMLTRPGIGQHSPTMARHRARRRTGKDVLALAVRKDFNAAIVLESELITSFLYAVQNQGKQYKRSRESARQVVDSLPRHEFPYAIRAFAGKTGQLLRGVYHRRSACSTSSSQVTRIGDKGLWRYVSLDLAWNYGTSWLLLLSVKYQNAFKCCSGTHRPSSDIQYHFEKLRTPQCLVECRVLVNTVSRNFNK